MKFSNLSRAIGTLATLTALALIGQAQTLVCEVGVANGGLIPPTGTGGGGSFPTTLPTAPAFFTLNVAALPPGATVVTEVKLIGLTHADVTELQLVLTDPGGARHNLWVRGPAGIFLCDWNGDYSIVERCVGLGQTPPTNCVSTGAFASGAYEQFFGVGSTWWPSGVNNIHNTPLSSIAAATGTWTLRAYDWSSGDVGSLTSFDICFGAPPPVAAPASAPILATPATGSAQFTSGTVSLSWSQVHCATSYEVDVDGVVTTVTSSPFVYTSAPGVHTWTVRALSAGGPGPWAAPFTFTDLGPPPTVLRPALIVGNSQGGVATIYAIDPNNGAALPIHSTSVASEKPWGMAYDSATNTLYWINGATLYSSPYANPLVPTNLGGITLNGAGLGCVSLSFSNGKLYGTRNFTTEAVYEINPVTLEAVQVYAYSSGFDFGGIDHDATTGRFYGLTSTPMLPNFGRGLYEIDLVGNTVTYLAPYPAGETDIDGLAVHNGLAYYVSDGPNTTQANFYVFDVATGAQVGTLPSPFTGDGNMSGATFVPSAPTSPVSYCTAGTSTNSCIPAMSATTQPNLANNAGCVITCTGLEGQKLGLFFYGVDNGGFSPNPWGASTSFLCVKAPTQRTPSGNSGGTFGACDGTLSVNWDTFQTNNPGSLGNPFSAGDSIYVQTWYRDPPSPKTTNLSDALEMTVQP